MSPTSTSLVVLLGRQVIRPKAVPVQGATLRVFATPRTEVHLTGPTLTFGSTRFVNASELRLCMYVYIAFGYEVVI